jgi:predicted pyridoxine 5'-phosphate oxidase superfamily flavin-nucleotide-binding protein
MVANGKPPRTVIIVSVERAYFHCGKALKRARLWGNAKQASAARMPGPNAMMAAAQWRRLCEWIVAGARLLPIGK